MHEGAGHIVQIAALHHVGQVRGHQEDAFLVGVFGKNGWSWGQAGDLATASENGCALLAVADGMGGLNAGEVASAKAIEMVQESLLPFGTVEPSEAKTVLVQAILNAHFSIENESKKGEGEMGSTLVLAWLLGSQLHVAWVGDSRCYLYRQGEGLQTLTKDHSLVQEMVDEGNISEAEAFVHPQRNVITQSLGIPGHDPEPSYLDFVVKPGDTILLCSDGLNTMLMDEQIAHILETEADPGQCASLLVEAANAAGGHDNITVVLAGIKVPFVLVENREEAIPTVAPTPIPLNQAKPSQKLIYLMLPLVAILAALTIWTATKDNGKNQTETLTKINSVETKAANETEAPIQPETTETYDTILHAGQPPDTAGNGLDSPIYQDPVLLTGDYVIQVNTYSTGERAKKFQLDLMKKLPGNDIQILLKEGQYKVLIVGFNSRKEAELFKAKHDELEKGMIYLEKRKS